MPQIRRLIRKQGGHSRIVLGAVALCGVLGGGGISHPLAEMVLQLALAALAVAWVWATPRRVFAQVPFSAWLIAGLVVLLPLAQLVPLPPALWQSLPGRGPELAALKLAGLEQSWRPLSLFPDLTIACALSMACAMLTLLMAATLTRTARTLALGVVALVALASVVVGAGQVGGGEGNVFRFYAPDFSFLLGFQNNRNSQADVLLIGMVCLTFALRDMVLARVLPERRRLVLGGVAIGSLVLALGVVLTGSRTGMAMLVPVVLAQAMLLLPWLKPDFRLRTIGLMAAGGVVAAGLAAYALRDNPMIGRALGRFATHGEFRPEIWTDTIFAIRTYLPWGTGMGTFLPVFMITERLEIVSDLVVNRAHNDFLELALEAGLPGLMLAVVIAGLLVRGALLGWLSGEARVRGQIFCATSALLIIGAHSLLDYPLRSMSLATIAAVCAAVLLDPRGVRPVDDD